MANFFDDLVKKMFPSQGKQPVAVKENFSLKEKELEDLTAWMKTDGAIELFAVVFRN